MSSAGPSVSQSASPSIAILASGEALPACTPGAPAASDTVTFIASGDAWALSPSGAHLTCLFALEDPGPFDWGPLGDRVLVGGLGVKGVVGGPDLASRDLTFGTVTWSRPTGTSIVYAPGGRGRLEKIRLDGTGMQDVTPLPSSRYLNVAYHPSGEAFVVAVDRDDGQSIWMSSNTGKKPGRLVFSIEGTKFGALGFEPDGRHLLYAAQHADNHAELHRIDVTDTKQAPVVWEGPVGPMILDIQPGLETGSFAWTSGSTACEESVAMAHTPSGTVRALPDEARPTRAVGWLDATKLLVATDQCDGRFDLSAVDIATASIVPLVSGVSDAAVRTAVPKPPAPLPTAVANVGSGFG